MKQSFYDKFAQPQQPAQVYRPNAHARIDSGDVQARMLVAAMFGAGAVVLSMSLVLATDWHLWPFSLAFGVIVFLGWLYVEMLDAKDLQRPDTLYQPGELSQTTAPQTITIRGEMQTGNKTTIVEFPADPDAIAKFARRIRLGSGFSERTAARAGITQTAYNQMRDQFLTAGWARWKDPANRKLGIELLETGAAWLEKAGE